MKAPTHIIGGAVFTGTLCSFGDVNIFGDWRYLTVCACFSILPDIDTTKSFIGRIFFPLAWIVNRKFGHRTITHSLLFFAAVWVTLRLLLYFAFLKDAVWINISLFALLSHFVLDMMTVSGIPLLFPFFRNPCVIPGNPAYRFNTNSWRSEIVVSGVCGLLCITMQPLFANGFWTSYNRTFATVQHVNRENQNTEYYVICEYSYIRNAQTHIGEAIVLESKENELILFNKQEVFSLSSDDPQTKINYTKPRISDIEKRFAEMHFFNVRLDSLQKILTGKLVSGLIQSNYNVRYVEDAITYYTNFIKFSNRYNFNVLAGEDSSRTAIKTNIAKLEASIAQHKIKFKNEYDKWIAHQSEINALELDLATEQLTPYERNRKQKELLKLKSRRIEEPVYSPPLPQIAELNAQQKAMNDRFLLFSGHITVYQFGYAPSETAAEIEHQKIKTPNFDIDKTSLLANLNK
ncbi:MAG: metal-dependent hydrolase [Prevotellaceae bacterium]|nr:metal-dependent hydrolase [Prevotellaceae bacterium]